MTYEDQLQTTEWKAKRFEILERDWYMCQKCMHTQNLNVHHKYYIEGRMAWEYPKGALITLCKSCHSEEHSIKTIKVVQSSLDEALERLVNVCTFPRFSEFRNNSNG